MLGQPIAVIAQLFGVSRQVERVGQGASGGAGLPDILYQRE
jgi:hypothetical protein